MKQISTAVVTALIAVPLTFGQAARAQGAQGDGPAVAQEIGALYRERVAAMNDLAAYSADREFAAYAPGFVTINQDGRRLPLAQVRETEEQVHQLARRLRTTFSVQQANFDGQSLVVRYAQRTEGLVSPPGHPEATVAVMLTGTYEDTWRRTPQGGWNVVVTRVIEERQVNGQVQAPGLQTPLEAQQEMNRMILRQSEALQHARDCASGYGYQCGGR